MALFNFTKSFGNYEKLITDFTVTSIDGKKMKLSDFKAKGFLLVNVASKCGFTKQYDDLQKIWTNYKDRKSTRLNSSHSQQSRMPSSA